MTAPAKQVIGVLKKKIIYLKHGPHVFPLVWLFWANLFDKGTQYKKLLGRWNKQSLAKQLTSLIGICPTNIGFACFSCCGIQWSGIFIIRSASCVGRWTCDTGICKLATFLQKNVSAADASSTIVSGSAFCSPSVSAFATLTFISFGGLAA